MEEYDVIIAGAGPAGGNCARELSKMGHDVLLLESSTVIGEPNFSTGGTPSETMKVFKLPKKVTDSPWSSVLVASSNERAEFVFDKRMGYVLNYKLLKQFLANEAKKKSAHILTSAIATNVIIKNNSIVGIKVNTNEEERRYFAKIVIDATGARSSLAKVLGLVKENTGLCTGIEYQMNGINFEQHGRLDFYVGSVALGGYVWIFPSGKNSAKVGVGIFEPSKRNDKPINLLRNFVASNKQTTNAKIMDFHGGSLSANGGIKNHVKNGFIAIGDAACQINPLAGEGIRHALYSGMFAAKVIDIALRKNDVSKEVLNEYNRKWKQYVGKKWLISRMMQKMFYSFDDKKWDRTIRILSKFSPEDAFEIGFNYRFDLYKKYFPVLSKMLISRLIRPLGL